MRIRSTVVFAMLLLSAGQASADGMVVDKVYHPYVLPIEREVEWRLASHKTNKGDRVFQRLGLGHSLSESLAVEGYLIGERNSEGEFGLQSYEMEARYMLSEQGRSWADWGLLFEGEREHNRNNWELTSGVLFEKEIGRTSLTMNAFAIYEWGIDINGEWESEFRAQYRYRWRPAIQPAIEIYTGQDFAGIGPAAMGIVRFDGQKQLKWEAGYIPELAHSGHNNTFRLALEYEY